ncbi:Brix domain-containing protein [Vulcanisaeta thermophila]|uniref:Brix domain-containing protein n=1 Tax=Vulcanisaeta thermophila TaxID=867917 RepID=UPI000853BC50|nr:ribosomal biogenesis protein [Vulcanisaeta thermophila]
MISGARVLLTSSRDASIRIRQFLNELEMAIPGAVKVNRGRQSLLGIATKAVVLGARGIVYVGSRGGNPGFIRFIRINTNEGKVEVLPYLVRIYGVKLLIDMPVRVSITARPRTAVVVSLNDQGELVDVLSEQLGLPAVVADDVDSVRGMYDVVITIRRSGDEHEVSFLDGLSMGPRGPTMWVSDVVYARPMVIRVG